MNFVTPDEENISSDVFHVSFPSSFICVQHSSLLYLFLIRIIPNLLLAHFAF
jgi:hypothetical protein